MQPVDKSKAVDLERLRGIPCARLLPLICDHAKKDPDFAPVKDGHSERWHVHAAGHDYEILTTGPKFFDMRADKGGGGAIDLTMYLLRIPFKQALHKLRRLNILGGT